MHHGYLNQRQHVVCRTSGRCHQHAVAALLARPVAGGGQYFVLRGLGDIFGFIAGWAVLLDFTIDIALQNPTRVITPMVLDLTRQRFFVDNFVDLMGPVLARRGLSGDKVLEPR